MVSGPLTESIIGRAVKKKIAEIQVHDLRDWTVDKHRTVDDAPYGGGAGMVFKIEPLYACLSEIIEKSDYSAREIVLTTPRGVKFDQARAVKLSLIEHLFFTLRCRWLSCVSARMDNNVVFCTSLPH